ncbi:MAG: transposase, partial [Nitrososphaera sp.]
GFAIPNPLNYTKMLKPLKRIQKKISRRQIGSNNYKKAVRFYQIIQERIKNRRRDLVHKLPIYAKKYDIVFVEKLHKLNMVQNHRLAKNILDSGWDTFNMMLNYKTRLEVFEKNYLPWEPREVTPAEIAMRSRKQEEATYCPVVVHLQRKN